MKKCIFMFRKSSIAIGLVILLVASFVVFKVFYANKFIPEDAKYEPVFSKNVGYVGDESCKKCHETTRHAISRKSYIIKISKYG